MIATIPQPSDCSAVATPSPFHLWAPWTITEVIDEIIDADALTFSRTGISARGTNGVIATGAAATRHGSSRPRAHGELVERMCIYESLATDSPFVAYDEMRAEVRVCDHDELFVQSPQPQLWQPARSNGVAFAPNWREACHRAAAELAERDRVLRSWYGMGPAPVPTGEHHGPHSRSYRWETYRLPADAAWSEHFEVVCAIAFPTRPGVPLLRGFAADITVARAQQRAIEEAYQGLAFLWDEDLPTERPHLTASPLSHLELYLWPPSQSWIQSWTEGHTTATATTRSGHGRIFYADLTAPHLRKRGVVVKAMCEAALPLVFGTAPGRVTGRSCDGGPPHPVA